MRVTREACLLNSVANHPAVRPWLGLADKGALDIGAVFAADPAHFALTNEYGGFVFLHKGEGIYEVHSMVLPEGRGRPAAAAAREAARLMFCVHGAHALTTYVPHANKAALGLVRLMGFARTDEDKANSYWRLDHDQWQARQRQKCVTL